MIMISFYLYMKSPMNLKALSYPTDKKKLKKKCFNKDFKENEFVK